MSRRNPQGSSAKKRRKRLRDWRPARARAIGETFWPSMFRLGENAGKRLGDLIHEKLELYMKTHQGEVLPLDDVSVATLYGLATRRYRRLGEQLVVTETVKTKPVTYDTVMLDYSVKK